MATIDQPEHVANAGTHEADDPVRKRSDNSADDQDDRVFDAMPEPPQRHMDTVLAASRRAVSHAANRFAGSSVT